MERNIKTAVHNRFDFEVADAATGEVKQRYTSYNIITDYFFQLLMAKSGKLHSIQVGTGTGTLDQTRRSLFTYLGFKVAETVECVKTYPTSYIRKKIVLLPGDFVGKRITEVGFSPSEGQGYIVSHSMLKDSEGNQIAIEKTATDVITIYATFYLTVGQPEDDSFVLADPATSLIIRGVLLDDYMWNYVIVGAYAPKQYADELKHAEIANHYIIRFQGNQETNVWTLPTTRFDYSEANVHMFQSIGSPEVAAWRLPNSATFPHVLLQQIDVGTGDGTTTVFDCPVPSIVPQSESIRKNGVLLERGTDYTLEYENNSLGLIELLASSDPNNFDVTGGEMINDYGQSIVGYDKTSATPHFALTQASPVVMDFRRPIIVNRLNIPAESILKNRNGNYSFDLTLEYSLDGETWTQWFTSGTVWTRGCKTDQWFDPELTFRYVRLSTTTDGFISGYNNVLPIRFGHIIPGLTFTTAPAEGDIITMDCRVNRPFKNENWVLDFGFTVTFERA